MQLVIRAVSMVAVLLAAAPRVAEGQGPARAVGVEAVSSRPQFDYFLSRYRPVASSQEGEEGAVGGRLMWPLEGVPGGWRARTSLGGYLIHAPQDTDLVASWRYGAQADFRLLRAPLAQRVEPIVSLGVGAVTMEESRWEPVRPPMLPATRPHVHTQTHLSLTPGVGLRIRLLPGIGLRGDARQAIDFGDGTRRNVEISGGLSVGS